MPEAVLVAAVRTPVGRAPKGALSTTRPDDLAAIAITGALDRLPALDKAEIDDVILGCAQPEGEQGWNIARMPHCAPAFLSKSPAPPSTASAPPVLRPSRSPINASAPALAQRHRRRRSRIHEPHPHGRQQAQPQSMAR